MPCFELHFYFCSCCEIKDIPPNHRPYLKHPELLMYLFVRRIAKRILKARLLNLFELTCNKFCYK